MRASDTTIPVRFVEDGEKNVCGCGRKLNRYGTCPVCGTENLEEEEEEEEEEDSSEGRLRDVPRY